MFNVSFFLSLRQRSRLSEAEEWYGKARRTAPDNPAVRTRYADFLSSAGRLDEAAEQYEAAAALASDDHEIAVKTATTLRKAGRTSDSEAYYRRAVRLYPQVSDGAETTVRVLLADRAEQCSREWPNLTWPDLT